MKRHIIKFSDIDDFQPESLIGSSAGRDGSKQLTARILNFTNVRFFIYKNHKVVNSFGNINDAIDAYNEL